VTVSRGRPTVSQEYHTIARTYARVNAYNATSPIEYDKNADSLVWRVLKQNRKTNDKDLKTQET